MNIDLEEFITDQSIGSIRLGSKKSEIVEVLKEPRWWEGRKTPFMASSIWTYDMIQLNFVKEAVHAIQLNYSQLSDAFEFAPIQPMDIYKHPDYIKFLEQRNLDYEERLDHAGKHMVKVKNGSLAKFSDSDEDLYLVSIRAELNQSA